MSTLRSSRSPSSSSNVGLGGLVLHQLDRRRSSPCRGPRRPRQVLAGVERGAERVLVRAHVAEEALALEDVEVGERDRAAHRVAAEGDAVQEDAAGLEERLGDAVADEHPAERRVAGREALGHGDHVGLVADSARSRTRCRAGRTRRSPRRRRAARRSGRRSRGPGRSSRRAGVKQPPAFCTGSRNTAATVSGPSCRIAPLDVVGAARACRRRRRARVGSGSGWCWRRGRRRARAARTASRSAGRPVIARAPIVVPW